VRNTFRLTLAADANSMAPTTGGTSYQNSDDDIRQMYLGLSASPVFASVNTVMFPDRRASISIQERQLAALRVAMIPPRVCERSFSDQPFPR
jgi:hypothetical protein